MIHAPYGYDDTRLFIAMNVTVLYNAIMDSFFSKCQYRLFGSLVPSEAPSSGPMIGVVFVGAYAV